MEDFILIENLTLPTTEIIFVEDSAVSNISELSVSSVYGPKRDSLYIVIPITVIYSIIFFMGLIGNISTCIVIARNKSMHTATNYYLFSLSISDLLLLVSGLPQEMYSIWSRYPYVFGYVFCLLRGFFAETSSNATVLTITAFTVERYVAICHPFLSHTMSKLSRAIKLILAIWLFAVCFAIPQALQFGLTNFNDNPDSVMCAVIKPIEHSFTVSTCLFFIGPMTLITVLYALIGLRLKKSNIGKKQSKQTLRVPSVRNAQNVKRNSSHRHHGQSSRRVVKMLVAVVVAFFICWAPFHTQRLVAIYITIPQDEEDRNKYLKIYEVVTYISGVLYYLSTSINPLLYNIMSNKFREAFKETFFTRCCGLSQFKPGRQERSYSVLSRSNQRAPDSTDSGKDETSLQNHSSLTQKTSIDSYTAMQAGSRRLYTKNRFTKSESDDLIQNRNFRWTREFSSTSLTSARKVVNTNFDVVDPNESLFTVHVVPSPKCKTFWKYFHCIAKRTLDDRKHFTKYYASPVKEPNIIIELEMSKNERAHYETSPNDSKGSSLINVEYGGIEDELTLYMQEIRAREMCN